MKHIYLIKFRDDKDPIKIQFDDMIHMIRELVRYMNQRGWIEWMHRE